MTTVDLGSDISTFAGLLGAVDFDPLFPEMTGARVALEGIARRLSTPRGSLGFAGLPDYGYDLITLCGKRMSPLAIARAEAAIAREASAEQGVRKATATITETAPMTYHVSIAVELADGPYSLVLSVSNLSIQLLRAARG